MPVNRTESAAKDLDKKLKLEKPLGVQTRTILRNMSKDLENGYAATGTVLDAKYYEDDFIGVLRPTYRKAEKQFGNNLTDELEDDLDNEPEDPKDRSFLLAAFYLVASREALTIREKIAKLKHEKNDKLFDLTNEIVPKRAALITSTNQDEINRSLSKATAEAVATDITVVSRADIAARAGQIFRDSSLYRGNMIATTEVQTAAEGAKSVEAGVYDEALSPLEDEGVTVERRKEWHTQGDEKVREAHVLADLQEVAADEPFIVDGEELMYPGDSSLGASPGNTINCRCSAMYFVDGQIDKVVTADSDTGSFL